MRGGARQSPVHSPNPWSHRWPSERSVDLKTTTAKTKEETQKSTMIVAKAFVGTG